MHKIVYDKEKEMKKMALEEFYQSIYHDIFLKWITLNAKQYSQDHIHFEILEENKTYCQLSFEMKTVKGCVTIWHNNIVEEEIKHKDSQELLFYLHYTIIDLAQAKSLFQEFYHTLIKHNQEKNIHIGICSSDGFSTSLFVEELKEVCQLENLQLDIDSLSLEELYKNYRQYDILYLAPQLAHQEPELLTLTRHLVPLYLIDPTLFATKDYQNMMKTIKKHLYIENS